MRTALTLGYEHGSGKVQILCGPEKHVNEHRLALKAMKDDSHAVYQRIEVWESSGGRTKYRDFVKPSASKPLPKAEESAPAMAEEPSKPAPKKGKAVA